MSSRTTSDPSGPAPFTGDIGPAARALPWPAWLMVHATVWTLAAWLSRANLDLSGDMAENYVWGIEWQAGYDKHPPLFAWICAAWFSVMPRTDLSYFALSFVNVAVGLLGVGALARRFLPTDAAVVAALVLGLSPLTTGLAMKFNANAVQLSVWPWAAVAFVAFMQGGRWRHAIACGALAALALMGKYFSVVLVLALVVVALAVPAWRARLRGAGPWLALLAGLMVLLPHLVWLFDQHFLTLRYASRRSEGSLGEALLRLANYSVAQLGYLLPGALFLLWSVRSGERRTAATQVVRSVLRPSLHRELWWLALAPMFVVAAIAVAARTPMASVWGMAQWFAVTALWLAVLGQQGIAPRSDWLRRALPVYWVGVLLAAAAVGYAEARRGSEAATVPRAELAHAVQTLWRERFGGTLPIVAGSGADVMSVAFYAPGASRWWCPTAPTATPWLTAADWRRVGGALVCEAGDAACQLTAQALVTAPAEEVKVRKTAWGITMPWFTYRVYLQRPS